MDNSKMAKAGTTIKYDLNKERYGMDQMSRRVKQRCGEYCCCEDCDCEKSLEDVLDPPEEDGKICC